MYESEYMSLRLFLTNKKLSAESAEVCVAPDTKIFQVLGLQEKISIFLSTQTETLEKMLPKGKSVLKLFTKYLYMKCVPLYRSYQDSLGV